MRSYVDSLLTLMDLKMGKEDLALFGQIIQFSVSTNPRGIKRVFNSLQLLVLLAEREDVLPRNSSEEERRLVIRILFALLCLQITFESIYQWIAARGADITEADLMALTARGDSARQDADLSAALARLTDSQRAHFTRFAEAFTEAVQTPGEPLDVIDEVELKRVRDTLALTRVTAVHASPGKAEDAPQDREFRWRNRVMMENARAALEPALREAIESSNNGFRSYQPHSSPMVILQRVVDSKRMYKLAIGSHRNGFEVWVESGKRAIALAEPVLRSCLSGIATPGYEPGETGPLFFRRELDKDTPMETRDRILIDEVVPFYLRAHELLSGKLEPENLST